MPESKRTETLKFLFQMAPIMSLNDKDGLGFAAYTNKGLVVEHWLNPKDAFDPDKRCNYSDYVPGKKINKTSATHNIFAENSESLNEHYFAILMHARMATTPVALRNVHPFVSGHTALIHNGIIGNAVSELKIPHNHCDSEAILNAYMANDVSKKPHKIEEVGKILRGSYTCGVLTKNEDGIEVLDLFRSAPPLHGCYIKELGGLVFCTSDTMVDSACAKLGYHHSEFFRLKDDRMTRLNARTGKFMSDHKFWSVSSYYNQYNRNWEESEWDNELHRWVPKKAKDAPTALPALPTQEQVEESRQEQSLKEISETTEAVAEKKRTPREIELALLSGMNGPKELGKNFSQDIKSVGKPEELENKVKDPFFNRGNGYTH